MFQRRHYNKIVEVLAIFHSKGEFTPQVIDEEFIAMLSLDNPNFNEKKFREAIEAKRW
tara:strand:- start:25036 stop:25209 length:174 start_codon:yes stop_codon:yes gene_type:complete